MFYRTIVQRVTSDGIIDVQGKSLTFIGNKLVKAGDYVWTDGNVVFGHTPIRGGDFVPIPDSRVPVLADKLRGYFKKSGNFKDYKIKGDEWIVNDKKNYEHDDGESDDKSKIIDAEIAEDGELYTVEKVIDETEEITNDSALFYYYYYRGRDDCAKQSYYIMMYWDRKVTGPYYNKKEVYRRWEHMTNPKTIDYVKDTGPELVAVDTYYRDAPITEYVHVNRTDDPIVRDCELVLKKNDIVIQKLKMSKLVEHAEEIATEYINIEIPGHESIDFIKSRARLNNFKILPNGKWTALIEVELGAERDYPQLERDHYGAYIEWTSPPSISFEWKAYSSVAVHSHFLLKITSDGEIEKIAEESYFMPLWLVDQEKNTGWIETNDVNHEPFHVNPTTFPYDDYVWAGSKLESGIGLIARQYTTFVVYDSHYMPDAPDYDNPEKEIADDFTFPVQDEYNAKIKNVGEDIDLWKFGGVYGKKNNQVVKELPIRKNDAHKWNMSLVPLKGDNYLFGVRKDEDQEVDGALYKISKDGTFEQVADGLKNFRLRELKQINKAKK